MKALTCARRSRIGSPYKECSVRRHFFLTSYVTRMSKYLDPTISCFSKSADCAREKLRVAQQQHLWTQQDLAAVGAKGASSVGESLKAQASCDPGNMMLARGCEEMEEERSPIHDARDMTPSSILWGLKRSVVWVFLYCRSFSFLNMDSERFFSQIH